MSSCNENPYAKPLSWPAVSVDVVDLTIENVRQGTADLWLGCDQCTRWYLVDKLLHCHWSGLPFVCSDIGEDIDGAWHSDSHYWRKFIRGAHKIQILIRELLEYVLRHFFGELGKTKEKLWKKNDFVVCSLLLLLSCGFRGFL